jgi:hypothetical protein
MVNAAQKILKPKAKTAPSEIKNTAKTIVDAKLAVIPESGSVTPAASGQAVKAAAVPPVPPVVVEPPVEDKTVMSPAAEVRRPAPKRKKIDAPAILAEADAPVPPAIGGPGEKFSLGPTHGSFGLAAPETELPESYGTKKLFLTARDPHWLYAHWDLTLTQQQAYNAESSDGHLVLRIYGSKFEGHPLYEIHVHPESRHWFVHVERAGNSYCAELGYYSPLGKWTRVSASSATVTPPDAASPETDVEFATIPFEFPFSKLVRIIEEAVRENLPLAQAIEELRRTGHPDLPRFKAAPAAAPALSQGYAAQTAQPPTNGHAPQQPVWTAQQEQALAKVVCIDQSRRVWMGSLEITELIRRRLTTDVSSPMRGFGGPAVSSYGLETVSSLSSPAGGSSPGSPTAPFGASPAVEKSFWFNVNAELIVYGATEPGAKVTLGGHEIKLRADGTFSYRFALPDGKYDLPAVAVSPDGTDTRAASLTFGRETAYQGEVGAHAQDSSLKAPAPDSLPENL